MTDDAVERFVVCENFQIHMETAWMYLFNTVKPKQNSFLFHKRYEIKYELLPNTLCRLNIWRCRLQTGLIVLNKVYWLCLNVDRGYVYVTKALKTNLLRKVLPNSKHKRISSTCTDNRTNTADSHSTSYGWSPTLTDRARFFVGNLSLSPSLPPRPPCPFPFLSSLNFSPSPRSPTPSCPFLSSFPFPLIPFPLKSWNPARRPGECSVSSPSGLWGGAPAAKQLWNLWAQETCLVPRILLILWE